MRLRELDAVGRIVPLKGSLVILLLHINIMSSGCFYIAFHGTSRQVGIA